LVTSGDLGQLGRGERLAAEERGEDPGARAIADQLGDTDDVGAVLHGSMLDEPLYLSNPFEGFMMLPS
jgi:hypothetical protein